MHSMLLLPWHNPVRENWAICNTIIFIRNLLSHNFFSECMFSLSVSLYLKSLAKLTDGFRNSFYITDCLQDLQHNSSSLIDSSLPQQYCDACSQTDIIGEVCIPLQTRQFLFAAIFMWLEIYWVHVDARWLSFVSFLE